MEQSEFTPAKIAVWKEGSTNNFSSLYRSRALHSMSRWVFIRKKVTFHLWRGVLSRQNWTHCLQSRFLVLGDFNWEVKLFYKKGNSTYSWAIGINVITLIFTFHRVQPFHIVLNHFDQNAMKKFENIISEIFIRCNRFHEIVQKSMQ